MDEYLLNILQTKDSFHVFGGEKCKNQQHHQTHEEKLWAWVNFQNKYYVLLLLVDVYLQAKNQHDPLITSGEEWRQNE